jgi:cytochrome P450
VAGSETTATLLTGPTYLLCKNPEKLKKVQQEVRTSYKQDSEITQKSVNELSYMIVVLSESMHVYRLTSFGVPRLIANKDGQSIAGCWVPQKVLFAIPGHFHIC